MDGILSSQILYLENWVHVKINGSSQQILIIMKNNPLQIFFQILRTCHTTYVFGKQNPNQNIYEWFFFQLIKTIENYVFVKRYKHHLFRPLTIYVCIDKYKV